MNSKYLARSASDEEAGSSDAQYTALIRTFNSAKTLPATLSSLGSQCVVPLLYVFVDSGSSDNTMSLAPSNSTVIDYEGKEFNFSLAINQGLSKVSTEYVLIISSHTLLQNPAAVKFALRLLQTDERFGAAYFESSSGTTLSYKEVDKTNFDGFNGLWNTCSLIKLKLLRERAFRPDVFSAEDQEWARWLFHVKGLAVARISGGGMQVENPRKLALRKRLNEYVAIAYFSNPQLLHARHIAGLIKKAVALPPGSEDRLFNLLVAMRLIMCWFKKPTGRSRYF